MKKYIFMLSSIFIIIASLLCGCGESDRSVESNKKSATQKVEISRYGEDDKPWGEYNYKNTGIIKNLEKDFDENITNAVFTIDGESVEDRIKIYGTDIYIPNYEGKRVFIAAVKRNNGVLVKRYQDINNEGLEVVNSINKLTSIDDTKYIKGIERNVESLKNREYKDYVISAYNVKLSELTEKKKKEEAEKRIIQDQELERQIQEQQQRKQEAKDILANSEVYIAASGKGECYHRYSDCSGMSGVNSMTRAEAEQMGYRYCEKCY